MTDYQPKHMIDREATLDRWQAQSAQAAAILSTQRLNAQDGQVWALLECLAKSRELNEVLYDYRGTDEGGYKPLHLALPDLVPTDPPGSHNPALRPSPGLGTAPPSRRRCGCGDIAWHPAGCGPSGCQNRPA